MSDLQDLYQELIIDHSKRPRNRRKPEAPDRQCDGFNPLCGDRITVYLTLRDGIVQDAAFEGAGCAISTASASLMTEGIKGKTVEQVRALFEDFRGLVMGSTGQPSATGLGKLQVFSGVCRYPARVKCATLAWHTMNAALTGGEEPVSTE